jgi:hypothetical protein
MILVFCDCDKLTYLIGAPSIMKLGLASIREHGWLGYLETSQSFQPAVQTPQIIVASDTIAGEHLAKLRLLVKTPKELVILRHSNTTSSDLANTIRSSRRQLSTIIKEGQHSMKRKCYYQRVFKKLERPPRSQLCKALRDIIVNDALIGIHLSLLDRLDKSSCAKSTAKQMRALFAETCRKNGLDPGATGPCKKQFLEACQDLRALTGRQYRDRVTRLRRLWLGN